MTPNHCYMGANKIDLTKDTNTVYTHPNSIQCNASSEINNLKSSVSNGKSLIASAITDKGVSTASDATFQTMANNIGNIIDAKNSATIESYDFVNAGLINWGISSGFIFKIMEFDSTTMKIILTRSNGYTLATLTVILS